MKLIKSIALLTAAITLSGCVFHVGSSNARSADIHLQESLTITSEQLNMLEVESGSGELVITGSDNVTEITVKADIYTDNDKNYDLSLKKVGSRAVLVAKNNSTSGFWNGNSPSIDLHVTVPKSLALDIDDGSGPIEVKNINNKVTIDDGSGSLLVKNIQGDVTIEDGSGELQVSNVSGNVDIDDGSGEMSIADISGSVKVVDGSGDMNIHHIGGSVTIDDGSGDIDLSDAGGLTITESGSGGLKVKDVKGEFNIDS
ncbi:DUF4097 family beta strand repeat-containing protein [Thalassomonas sp. M1454]|uniref:DUF4097 family beta strand repeat-containing protein n=1 Tax=Thalassomonas sp. M1454 TaxID=2594477 RepID=UPI00118171B2|nr:DUF4097 family beta strand repeat-containing protein [Thalassomonas sp. M1454]TRX55747.1 DUF4097 domain-containing protein [Thalassomonas sp. M1454]